LQIFIPFSFVSIKLKTLIAIFKNIFWQIQFVKTNVMGQPAPVKLMVDQKQLENMEFFKYLGSMLTNYGRCACEIKSRIAMAKAAFNKKRALLLVKCT
jgi:hypothetical protein